MRRRDILKGLGAVPFAGVIRSIDGVPVTDDPGITKFSRRESLIEIEVRLYMDDELQFSFPYLVDVHQEDSGTIIGRDIMPNIVNKTGELIRFNHIKCVVDFGAFKKEVNSGIGYAIARDGRVLYDCVYPGDTLTIQPDSVNGLIQLS
jgi:hypothetical protein